MNAINQRRNHHRVFYGKRRVKRHMNSRTLAKYIIDLGLLITAIVCIVTGIVKFPELIRYVAISGLVLPYNEISLAHDWSGVVLLALVLVHLALNGKWLSEMTRVILKGTGST
jgi:hypothetical protein